MTRELSVTAIRDAVSRGVESGTTPGAVVSIGDGGQVVLRIAHGHTQTHPTVGTEVAVDTIYDIASVTKAVATAAVLMRLVGEGALSLDHTARRFLPELPQSCSGVLVRHLVGHAAGFPAHRKFYEELWARPGAEERSQRQELFELALATDPIYPAGTRAIYSDVGFILLGLLLERASGERLDQLTRRWVCDPLEMGATRFVDLDAEPTFRFPAGQIAVTEECPRRGLVCGEVHDENAHAGGGVFGHAGLFSTAPDLDRFARSICDAFTGEAPSPFDREVVQEFFSTSAAPGTTWRLGWDSPSAEPGISHAGSKWPETGVGHLGFTGTSLWLDPARRRWVTILTNRVHESRDKEPIRALRRNLMDAAVDALRV